MFNPVSILIDAFIPKIASHYIDLFGENKADLQLIRLTARNTLEIIANSNAPYHDINHTMLITLVGAEIIKGKIQVRGQISANDWVHMLIALLHHDIGYVRGICKADRDGRYAINNEGDTIAPPAGATDAFLTPYHVDRAKIFITEHFLTVKNIDVELVCAGVERTRFPIPCEADHQGTDDMAGLIRAADLIGQLADPQYFCKISRLFAEFKETGSAAKLGYTTAADMQANYPKFYWETISPYIQMALKYLRATQDGQAWVANLYANVFTEEHQAPSYGPERRNNTERRIAPKSLFNTDELKSSNSRKKFRRMNDRD
ncbi:MAG: hypothetical protein KUG79_01795 [Pseudomonadales bacterium]|nr:hypothetical protein [Pseudomonadales bacterium]